MTPQVLIELAIQSTIVLAAAGLVCNVWRGASAATRHLVWLTSLLATAALPAVRLAPPLWRPSPGAAETMVRPVVEVLRLDVTEGRGAWLSGWDWLFVVYGAGVVWALSRWAAGVAATAALARRAQPWAEGVRLSTEIDVPLVCGLRRPVVLLPMGAASWSESRRSVVLMHERMHIQRRDILWQTVTRWICAIWWPHPLVWHTAAELRKECERACDDGVLVTGVRPSEYAERLLEVARAASDARTYEGGLAMAKMTGLEGRLRWVLSTRRNRGAARLRPTLAILAFGGLLAGSIAALRIPALAQSGEIRGVVQDASGARVPKARVLVTNLGGETRIKELVLTNEVGEFWLTGIPDGTYEVRIEKSGFARLLHSGVKVGPGAPTPISATLNIGSIQETVAVVAQREGGVPGAAQRLKTPGTGTPSRLAIGGNVQQTRLINQVRPAYPPECKREGVQGSVFLRAIISKEGTILSLEPLNKVVDARLVQAAVDAVKQWRYAPTLLNGQPVEVITEVEINFTLQE